jgi:AcrR family transcriptional regulator
VFARHGYAAATLDQVADAAGFTKGAFYSNFASKEELFLALIDRSVEHEGARLAAQASGNTVPLESARAGGSEAVDQQAWSLDWLILAMEFWLHAMRHEKTRQTLADQYERFRRISTQVIAERLDALGIEPPMPPRDLAILIEAVGAGLGVQHALDPARVDLGLQRAAVNRLLGIELFVLEGQAQTPRPHIAT